jgi:hypothetical protein
MQHSGRPELLFMQFHKNIGEQLFFQRAGIHCGRFFLSFLHRLFDLIDLPHQNEQNRDYQQEINQAHNEVPIAENRISNGNC